MQKKIFWGQYILQFVSRNELKHIKIELQGKDKILTYRLQFKTIHSHE